MGIIHTNFIGDSGMPDFGDIINPFAPICFGIIDTPPARTAGEMGMGRARAFGIIETPPCYGVIDQTG